MSHRRIPGWARITFSVALLGALIWFVLIPLFAQAGPSLESVQRLSIWLVVAAAAVELGSLLAFSGLTATVVGAGGPRYRTLLAIDLTDLAVNHTVPGGGTVAAGVRYRLLVAVGTRRSDALAVAAIETISANIMVGLLFAVGLALSITNNPESPYFMTAAIAVIGLIAFAGVGGWVLVRHEESSIRVATGILRRLRITRTSGLESLLRTLAERLRMLSRDPRRMSRILLFALANCLLDAASLWIFLAACGSTLALGPLLTVYGAASIVATLPLTPGGLGIVEGLMVPALVGFGVSHPAALLGVLGWRLVEYWLPIPLGAVASLVLRISSPTVREAGVPPSTQAGASSTHRLSNIHRVETDRP